MSKHIKYNNQNQNYTLETKHIHNFNYKTNMSQPFLFLGKVGERVHLKKINKKLQYHPFSLVPESFCKQNCVDSEIK